MTSFSWNKKIGEKVSKAAVQQFKAESTELEDVELGGVNCLLEDCAAKSKRLKDEGALMAKQNRHWEAVRKWDKAIQLTPEDAVLHEMKSQVLTVLQEDFLAVQAAEMTVKLQPMWWEGWQTLGRAQLNLGEVELAARSFQVALHLHPIEHSLWEKDLGWAQHLRREKRAVQQKATQDDQSQNLINEPPELQQDYGDYECDEVIDACTAIEDRQKRYEKLRKNIIVDVQDVSNEILVRNSNINASKSSLIKARKI